jgi:hypothetical protein
MPIHTSSYINQLNLLLNDINSVMKTWPVGPSFDIAKQHADTIAPLIAGQIQALQNCIRLNPCDPMALHSEVEKLANLMTHADEKKKFAEYTAMLDSLISELNL